jgi:hypothetical protein
MVWGFGSQVIAKKILLINRVFSLATTTKKGIYLVYIGTKSNDFLTFEGLLDLFLGTFNAFWHFLWYF